MEETLEAKEEFLKSLTIIKSNDRSIHKVRTHSNKGSKTYSINKERVDLMASAAGLKKILKGSRFENLAILEYSALHQLLNSDLKTILNLVESIHKLSKVNVGVDHVQEEINEVLDICYEVLSSVGDKIKSFTEDDPTALLSQMDRGKIVYLGKKVLVPSKEDLDIVTALRMTGIDLQFNDGEWKLNVNEGKLPEVSFVPRKDDKPLIVFNDKNIQFLLEEHLNLPQGKRKHKVVPSKLLQVYVNEYERKLVGGRDNLSPEERGLIDQEVARQRRIFSMDSNEFQITKLIDRDTIMRNAQRAALVSLFENKAKSIGRTKDISNALSSTVNGMSMNPAYEDIRKGLTQLVSILDNTGNRVEDATEFEEKYNVDFEAQYDRQIEYLRRTNASDAHIKALEKAKKEFIEATIIQKVYWQSKLELATGNGGNIFSAELANALNESMGFAVQLQNDGGFVMANGETVQAFLAKKELDGNLYEELKNQVLAKHGNSPTREKSGSERSALEYPADFILDYAVLLGGAKPETDNWLVDYANMRFYQSMWQDGCLLDLGFEAYKKTHEKATIEDYVKHFSESQADGMFDPNLIEDAYYLVHGAPTEEKQNRVQNRINEFNEYLLKADLILEQFSPEEVEQYCSMEDGEAKRNFLKNKWNKAENVFNKLKSNPESEDYKNAIAKAKKRHESGAVHSIVKRKWENCAKEVDEAKFEGSPVLSSAVDAFLRSQMQEYSKNNKDLAKDGLPIVKSADIEQDNTAEAEGKKDKKKPTTFGDMFPSGPNVNKFLKLMKPYSAKAVIKYFIEPLLADIEKTKINLDAYYAKVSSAANGVYKGNVPSGYNKPQVKDENEESNEAEESPEGETSETTKPVEITQRDFEASTFIPGALIFDNLVRTDKDIPVTQNISYVFKCLASTDKSGGMGNVVDGKDYRDALREFAIDLCGKKFIPKSNIEVSDAVGKILDTYGIDDPDVVSRIRAGFAYITPELLAYAFEPCSKLESGKLTIGSELPIEQLVSCKDDAQRRKAISDSCDMRGSYTLLKELVGEKGIYRDNMGAMDLDAINLGFNRTGESIPQMAELMRLKDAMKAKGMAVSEDLQKDESEEMEI